MCLWCESLSCCKILHDANTPEKMLNMFMYSSLLLCCCCVAVVLLAHRRVSVVDAQLRHSVQKDGGFPAEDRTTGLSEGNTI